MGVLQRWCLGERCHKAKDIIDGGLYCNEGSSRIIADVRDERDQLNEAILALERMPFHVFSVQFLTNGGVTPIGVVEVPGTCWQSSTGRYTGIGID